MVKEDIKILITDTDGKTVADDNQYTTYAFDTQYGVAASAFTLTLADLKADIEAGYGVQLLINNRIEFRGIVQRRSVSSRKGERSLTITGKDRASILVEGYCNKLKDFNDESPQDIIDTLIAQTNFYTKPKGTADTSSDSTGFNLAGDVTDHNTAILADVNNNKTLSSRTDTTTYGQGFQDLDNKTHFKIGFDDRKDHEGKGDKVFARIQDLVDSVGMEILYQENGTLYIGDLNKKRAADTVVYNIVYREDGSGNNAESVEFSDDISGRHSTISISSQSEGKTYSSGSHVNKEAIATDSTLEAKKYMARHINGDEGDPAKIAIMTRENQRVDGYQLTYEVPGHIADNGKVWTINRYVNVFDDVAGVYEHLVLYGRTFTYNKGEGTRTTLRLSKEKLFELAI